MISRRRGRFTNDSRGFRDFVTSARRRGDEIKEEPEIVKEVINLNNTEEIFLRGLLDSPKHHRVKEAHDPTDAPKLVRPHCLNNLQLIKKLSEYRGTNIRTIEQAELAILLSKPHFRALIDTHDKIGAIWVTRLPSGGSPEDTIDNSVFVGDDGEMPAKDAVKIVGIRKQPDQPLGLTVSEDEHGQLVVARVLAGGAVAQQGLLGPGDVVLEVNGFPISSPEQLKAECARAGDHITLKVGPNNHIHPTPNQINKLTCYMRTLFEYNPSGDSLLPCRQIGLPFNRGDILQITDRKDPNWWQACKLDTPDVVGLVPSPELEERRKAFVPPEADFVHKIGICGTWISKKKRKFVYESRSASDFDGADLVLYEEVTRMPPFNRKTLVLIGCEGVGRRTLKKRLINSDPSKFGSIIPHTSRPMRPLEVDGHTYWFRQREDMEREIKIGEFLEYGEHNGHLYGTHFDAIRAVIESGKMCILDCSPAFLKLLYNSPTFLPYVVFVAAPGMEQLKNLNYSSSRNLQDDDVRTTLEESACLQRTYEKYIDLVIVNQDFDATFRRVVEALDSLSTDHQWVPVNWVY
ncbi:MAGUK p55 subfamily member vari isoform X2 [Arctopsyche grandis]|uniref:MAGUK p55 subfamily member vari isoform X2 n=1 Tax=Arctopsyche grandis TaxID=121162 RepID=UPI00406D932E